MPVEVTSRPEAARRVLPETRGEKSDRDSPKEDGPELQCGGAPPDVLVPSPEQGGLVRGHLIGMTPEVDCKRQNRYRGYRISPSHDASIACQTFTHAQEPVRPPGNAGTVRWPEATGFARKCRLGPVQIFSTTSRRTRARSPASGRLPSLVRYAVSMAAVHAERTVARA